MSDEQISISLTGALRDSQCKALVPGGSMAKEDVPIDTVELS